MDEVGEKRRVCVTGAGGFVASWLVKLLLSKGYMVHGTVRDPRTVVLKGSRRVLSALFPLKTAVGDEKNAHLKKLERAAENLQVYKVDLLDYNTVASAIAGCEGVFHVASPVPSTKSANPEIDVIAPAVTGTLNVLRACSEAKVKRAVVVSSCTAVLRNPNWPQRKIKDEDCWSDKEFCRATEDWYSLSKTLAESEALQYAEKYGLDVVTVCPTLVIGPMLQSAVNSSSLFLINLLKGGRESMENKVRHIVDVRDVADALLLVYEKPEASGRYICAPHAFKMHDLMDMLRSLYPNSNYPKNFIEVGEGGRLSSEKLMTLGWKYRTLGESLGDSIEYYQDAGFLSKE